MNVAEINKQSQINDKRLLFTEISMVMGEVIRLRANRPNLHANRTDFFKRFSHLFKAFREFPLALRVSEPFSAFFLDIQTRICHTCR